MAYNGQFWEYPPKERQSFFCRFLPHPAFGLGDYFTDTDFFNQNFPCHAD